MSVQLLRNTRGMLRIHPVSLHEPALLLDSGDRDVEADVQHLMRSLRNSDWRAVVTAARCRTCGFRFHPDKRHKSGKCPARKGTWLSEPLIGLEARQ